MALAKSASAPGLQAAGSSKLKGVGATISLGDATTNLYDQMKAAKKFRVTPHDDHVRPAGRSIIVPLADSSERDVQPEIYFPAPPTPVKERRFRGISHGPGEIHVHYGLKDQKLPGEDFRYGIRGCKGSSTEQAMKAGQMFGVAEYKNSVAERVYESNKQEPLGRPHIRGHNVKMLPEGHGNASGEPADAKMVIFPVDGQDEHEEPTALLKSGVKRGDTKLDVDQSQFAIGDAITIGSEQNVVVGFGSVVLKFPIKNAWPPGTAVWKVQHFAKTAEGIRQQYKKSHNSFLPGERVERGYTLPDAAHADNFRFGKADTIGAEGAGSKIALNWMAEDDGHYKQTKFVQKVAEDYRNVQHPKIMGKVHCKQGPTGPPMHPSHRYGISSSVSDYTARSCIMGYYSLGEQLPDQDLGLCTKPGRRNVTSERRAFGVPSVRTDVAAPPPGKKSIADMVSYGDECGAAALLTPQRFDSKGVPDAEFLVRRPKEELRQIVEAVQYDMCEDFHDLFDRAADLFDDGMPLVSLDALLYLHQQGIDNQVVHRLTMSSSAPILRKT